MLLLEDPSQCNPFLFFEIRSSCFFSHSAVQGREHHCARCCSLLRGQPRRSVGDTECPGIGLLRNSSLILKADLLYSDSRRNHSERIAFGSRGSGCILSLQRPTAGPLYKALRYHFSLRSMSIFLSHKTEINFSLSFK